MLYGKTNKRTKKLIKQIKTKESEFELMHCELQFILIIHFDYDSLWLFCRTL